jgi:hypothetical protein
MESSALDPQAALQRALAAERTDLLVPMDSESRRAGPLLNQYRQPPLHCSP